MTATAPVKQKHCWIVPEVVQTSNMDCGPAALKCLLEGFGQNVSYGRLREACQTDVDGTSIDTLEDIAVQLGMDAQQVVVPKDHILLTPSFSLPAIVVVRLPNGSTHFIVAWRKHFNQVQLMDPATGRRWSSVDNFLDELYTHTMEVPAEGWREWAGSDDFTAPLKARIELLGASPDCAEQLVKQACDDSSWLGLGFLDGATRMVAKLVASGGVKKGQSAADLLAGLWAKQQQNQSIDSVPAHYWSVRPVPDETDNSTVDNLHFSGAVLIRVNGTVAKEEATAPESADLRRALQAPKQRPLALLLGLLKKDGFFAPLMLIGVMLISAMAVLVEALLFRGLIDIHQQLGLFSQRLATVGLIGSFLCVLILIEYPVAGAVLRFGRHLENRLRVLFLEKLPRIGDRYFHSRPGSDMAERSHNLHSLRQLPSLVETLLHGAFHLLATMIGIIYLAPTLSGWLILMVATLIMIPLVFQPLMSERDLRVRTHSGALSKYFLDALLGLVAIRAHSAQSAVRHQHENLQLEWTKASRSLLSFLMTVQGLQALVSAIFTIALVLLSISAQGQQTYLLLLVYWLLIIPRLCESMAQTFRQYAGYRNITLRVMEPLGVTEQENALGDGADTAQQGPVAIDYESVWVKAGGHFILNDINLHIAPGEHVAIVGRSGAGKSGLVGILLGWLQPMHGQVLINGVKLQGDVLTQLRRNTAWVDPSVQLWNNSILSNLEYGVDADNGESPPASFILEQADLMSLLGGQSDGLQTQLGEGGALVSGGEGQRVRFGRALGRSEAGCVILDEAFRGLDRDKRQTLLNNARDLWKQSTLLCVSHDIEQTLQFPRVLVVDQGQIVEDGKPCELAQNLDSHYSQLLKAEQDFQPTGWQNEQWRHLVINQGQLSEQEGSLGGSTDE